MNDALDVGSGLVDGGVQHEAGLINPEICCAFFNCLSLKQNIIIIVFKFCHIKDTPKRSLLMGHPYSSDTDLHIDFDQTRSSHLVV